MENTLHFRPAVIHAREKLVGGRDKLRIQHDLGSPGIQVCARLADLLDTVLLDLYRAALADGDQEIESRIALVAHGGYGRRDVAPYSDVDLMLLHEPGVEQRIGRFARQFTQSIYDAGLQLGFSLRTSRQACSLALGDATIFTSLVESRFLGGSAGLFTRFLSRFRRNALRRSSSLIHRIEQSRRDERRRFGETVYLLKPNVKRSRGGLRDLQLLRWVGFARYGEAEPESLERLGFLPAADKRKLRSAWEFLLRLRNELQFFAGKSQDVLEKDEQLRIAELFGYTGNTSVLPVERFLREYIEHTSEVRYVVAHFVASAKSRFNLMSVIDPLLSHRVEGDYRVGPLYIGATRRGLEKLKGDLAEVLRLMDLANRYNNRIDHMTWQAIRDAMMHGPAAEVSPLAAQRFLSLLSQPGRLGNLLRRLHELRVLEQLIPAMAHARSLMQFNDYHKYTVDEHSIRAVECATEFIEDSGPLGEAYRHLREKRLLHLALLVHDLGKGYPQDHSEVGRRLADETAVHLRLGQREAETLKFLVHKHLLMSHLAQRRDINDDAVVVQFAVQVGSLERLQLLYVLTCADLAAVGPGVLNRWKLDLITRLYLRTREQLAGEVGAGRSDEWLAESRQQLRRLAAQQPHDTDWWYNQIDSLPQSYLSAATAEEIIEELDRVRRLPHDQAVAWGRFRPDRKAVEYTVGAYEEITAGIFHKLTGALTSQGAQILSAEIHTLPDQLVLDRFYVHDLDHADEPPPQRLAEVSQALVAALTRNSDAPPTFRRIWARETPGRADQHVPLATQIRIDNNTSERYTILDIFAHDRIGLLYAITRNIFELALSVHGAKIGTYLDQVVDVFFVTDIRGCKITDNARLEQIRNRLQAAIDEGEAASDE